MELGFKGVLAVSVTVAADDEQQLAAALGVLRTAAEFALEGSGLRPMFGVTASLQTTRETLAERLTRRTADRAAEPEPQRFGLCGGCAASGYDAPAGMRAERVAPGLCEHAGHTRITVEREASRVRHKTE